jgi:hypothetical protein
MTELQAQTLLERISEEAPHADVTLVPISGNQHICRIGSRTKPFFIWGEEDWIEERWRFATNPQKVEVKV